VAARECGKKKMTQEGARTEKAQNQRKPVSLSRRKYPAPDDAEGDISVVASVWL